MLLVWLWIGLDARFVDQLEAGFTEAFFIYFYFIF